MIPLLSNADATAILSFKFMGELKASQLDFPILHGASLIICTFVANGLAHDSSKCLSIPEPASDYAHRIAYVLENPARLFPSRDTLIPLSNKLAQVIKKHNEEKTKGIANDVSIWFGIG